jgi:hypothetical protein
MSVRGHAELYINDRRVGAVEVQRTEGSWSHGTFRPNEAFGPFAPLFGRWSLLMHADGEYERLSRAAGEELREVECEIDRLHAKLRFAESGRTVRCAQLNIDGVLIEWKCA